MHSNLLGFKNSKIMQIIIPMSGFGERFRAAGYVIPKSLIEVDGKPIIQHVVEMFPGEKEVFFICNENHLIKPEFKMEDTLNAVCPSGTVLGISEHKLGPVYAVLQGLKKVNLDEPTIVNYCDFTCYWDFSHFKKFVANNKCDGAIPSYRGFHPHTLWNNNYAYIKENDSKILDIQEKKPFTSNPNNEFASSGTYYFKSATMMKEYFERCIEEKLMVGEEYYVSMPYKPMIEDGLNILVYELNYFMQWGTPQDLHDYRYWSNVFNRVIEDKKVPFHKGNLLVPMVGEGRRFAEQGYSTPKPLISVGGRPMAIQAIRDLPKTESQTFILREDLPDLSKLIGKLSEFSENPHFSILESLTDGQATTCIEGSKDLARGSKVTIGACDNGMQYDEKLFDEIMADDSIDVIVWAARGYPGAIRFPENYGWIDVDTDGYIKKVSVKKQLSDPSNDPIIVGAFTFKSLDDFIDSINHMKHREAKVNGEYYIDMAINDAIQIGKVCKIFEIENYICWGTPDDLMTYEYWQSCFHKWNSHKYRLENDRYIESESLPLLKRSYLKRWENRNSS